MEKFNEIGNGQRETLVGVPVKQPNNTWTVPIVKGKKYFNGGFEKKNKNLFCFKELALELASLMAQIDFGDCTSEKLKSLPIQALDRFYPYRYRDTLSPEALKELQELLTTKWLLLKGKSVVDCVRIYLTCTRKWQFFGAALFQAQPRFSDMAMTWIAVAEDACSVLELSSMTPIARHSYDNILTFGGHEDDFMLVVSPDDEPNTEKKFLFALSKPKILELTMLIADYMNALGHTLPGTPKANTLTRNNSHRSIK